MKYAVEAFPPGGFSPRFKWNMWLPLEEGPLNLYHHVPTMYGLYRAYGGIFREQTARVLVFKGTHPKNPWTLEWKGLNLYSRGPGPQISHF